MEEVTRTRRRLRRPGGGASIVEVARTRGRQGRLAVESFGIESADLDIELLEELETEIETLKTIEEKPVVHKRPRTVEIPAVNPKTRAQEMLAHLFSEVPDDEAVEDAAIVWVAATTALIRAIEASK